MTPNQAAAFVAAQTALMTCRMNAMVAENKSRSQTCGFTPYGEDAFLALEREFDPVLGYNAVIGLYMEAKDV